MTYSQVLTGSAGFSISVGLIAFVAASQVLFFAYILVAGPIVSITFTGRPFSLGFASGLVLGFIVVLALRLPSVM